MIDFRFHMVSLAAVLIALSMGIVLGAGPLNDNIGDTLTGEVTRLRQDKDDLRTQVTEQQRLAKERDTFDESVLPQVVAGRLDGKHVVVRLPESEDSTVSALEDTLGTAGAADVSTIALDSSWTATGSSADRARTSAARAVLTALGRSGDDAAQLPDVLGMVLGGRTSDGTSVPDRDQRTAAFSALDDAGLLTGTAPADPADLVVVVGGPVAGETQGGPVESDPAALETATTWVRLATVLDQHTDGVVLAASPAGAGSGDASPVTVARDDTTLSKGVSTVDVPEMAIGRADVVLALVQQAAGGAGSYGLATDAEAVIPDEGS